MTTYVEARDAIVTLVSTNLGTDYPDLELEWENTVLVDLDAVGDRFLKIEVDIDGADQLTMDAPVQHQTWGLLHFTLMVKEGSGIRDTLILLQYLGDMAKYTQIEGVWLGTPTPGPRRARDGWRSYELSIPFEFDSFP